ncbi:MAG: sigma-70 family RNA polymerase sigma factor [Gammaproteobacteria bacterium]|nr:sigma-70 family RNA polymerase sigma factor [Gammaproteobacteria bacterium]MBU1723083.1 sigma-70 family RNA polymerase sigma factor [Gammaproteobacteria bacterium]MBU2004153.1 sigma-70 family RNA polymerase sigma factor [Gammaproteobacteria bacterium]
MAQDQTHFYPLLERIRQGDQEALGILYDATVRRVFAVAFKITSNHELAEEIVSDVYLQVWRTAAAYDMERSTPLGWLLMLAHSRALDTLRREASSTKLQVEMPETVDVEDTQTLTPQEVVLDAEQGSELQAAIRLLDGQQRQMLALAFYRGMSHQEIADYTGEPLGTVKTILRRAQAILRAALTDSYPNVDVS